MSLRTTIEEKYKSAIKAKSNNEINTLRLIKSAIKDKDIASRTTNDKEGIKDSEILSLLQNLIKQRNDSIESFESAGRDDLAKIEKEEIVIITQFLPNQKSEQETEVLISNIIKEENYENIKDMGKLMSVLKSKHAGSLDMGLAGKIAKSKLSN